MKEPLSQVLNRLAKWRMVFASWQLGTRDAQDAECRAVRDHREATIMLRAETNALYSLMLEKGVFTYDEWADKLALCAADLDHLYQVKFPGFRATEDGISVDAGKARETMKGWRP